jgi:four helix bundle protein
MNNETMNNETMKERTMNDETTKSAAKKSPQDIQERTFKFGVRVVNLVERMPRKLSAEVLAKQLMRSGLSVGANMQEADGAESKDDFIHKVSVAYKEVRESRHWLKTIQETVMKGDEEVAELWKEADELVRILFAILRKARLSDERPSHTKHS